MQDRSHDAERAFDSATQFLSDATTLARVEADEDRDVISAFRYWAASRTGEVAGIPLAFGRVLFGAKERVPWWNESSREVLPFESGALEPGLEDKPKNDKPFSETDIQFAVSVAVLAVRDRLRKKIA